MNALEWSHPEADPRRMLRHVARRGGTVPDSRSIRLTERKAARLLLTFIRVDGLFGKIDMYAPEYASYMERVDGSVDVRPAVLADVGLRTIVKHTSAWALFAERAVPCRDTLFTAAYSEQYAAAVGSDWLFGDGRQRSAMTEVMRDFFDDQCVKSKRAFYAPLPASRHAAEAFEIAKQAYAETKRWPCLFCKNGVFRGKTCARCQGKKTYEDGKLDNGLMGILADALEDAQCQHRELLDHLRSGGTHYKGCWAMDAILGKEQPW